MFKVSKNPIGSDVRIFPDFPTHVPINIYRVYSDKSTDEVYKQRKYLMDRLSTTSKDDLRNILDNIFILTYILGERVVDV